MMVRGAITRFISVTAALAAVLIVTVGFAPAAQAAPKPTAIVVTGKGMDKLTVEAAKRGEVFQLLLSEVSWLSTATPQTAAPKTDKRGPKYVLTVYAGKAPQQVYDLYPLAAGGPRAYRPEKQPTGKRKAGWFYGRLTMSESLRVSGVPIKKKTDVVNGGIGGGVGEEVRAEQIDPVASVNTYLTQLRQLFLINGAVLVVILFGLAGVAFQIRRRV
jgi:hypothetical protein